MFYVRFTPHCIPFPTPVPDQVSAQKILNEWTNERPLVSAQNIREHDHKNLTISDYTE